MTDFHAVAQAYIAIWNEPDPTERDAAISALWTTDASYVDPLAAVTGHADIAAVITTARQTFPGHEFRLLPGVDGHHDTVRFRWELVPTGGGESVVEGFDVALLTDDGRISGVRGFLDKVPA